MDNCYHIIITGESGNSRTLQFSRKKVLLASVFFVLFFTVLATFSYCTTGSYLQNKLLHRDIAELKKQLSQSEKEKNDYFDRISSLEKQQTEEIAGLMADHETALSELKTQFDLENTTLQLENVRLITTAINDLNERKELIESIMSTIGVKIKKPEKQKTTANTGGPFIPVDNTSYESLLNQIDTYVKKIRIMPLGKPVNGTITSGFGKRTDPINKKKSFHEGVDLKGKRGDKIYATADGTVLRAFKNGSYGNYVELDHGNGYTTAYAHMQNYLVRKGERVEQGQVIGQVGNTGRSTGPHVHYEVRYKKKPINPKRFMKVATITHTFSSPQETTQ